MDMTATHLAVQQMIRSFGSSCKLEKVDGSSVTVIGVLLSGQSGSTPASPNSFLTKVEKTAYLAGKLSVVPKPGDAITFKPNTFIIKSVKAISLGEGNRNVFAYKLVVST